MMREDNAIVCCSMIAALTHSKCLCPVLAFAEPPLLAWVMHWDAQCSRTPMWDVYRSTCLQKGATPNVSF